MSGKAMVEENCACMTSKTTSSTIFGGWDIEMPNEMPSYIEDPHRFGHLLTGRMGCPKTPMEVEK